jgi:hypothetical protein
MVIQYDKGKMIYPDLMIVSGCLFSCDREKKQHGEGSG